VVHALAVIACLFHAQEDLAMTPLRQLAMYAGGQRMSETIRLRPEDIDSKRGMICIRQGKGRKDRYVPLSEPLLDILRSRTPLPAMSPRPHGHGRGDRPQQRSGRLCRYIMNCRRYQPLFDPVYRLSQQETVTTALAPTHWPFNPYKSFDRRCVLRPSHPAFFQFLLATSCESRLQSMWGNCKQIQTP
jgi:hypothetical protein